MPENVAKLRRAGAEPEVEIVIGNLQRGDHLIVLFDQNGENGVVVGKTENGVPIAFRYQIPRPLESLDGSLLRWNCILGTSTPGEGQVASVTLKVLQNGKVVDGGEITTTKKIKELDIIKDQVRLALV